MHAGGGQYRNHSSCCREESPPPCTVHHCGRRQQAGCRHPHVVAMQRVSARAPVVASPRAVVPLMLRICVQSRNKQRFGTSDITHNLDKDQEQPHRSSGVTPQRPRRVWTTNVVSKEPSVFCPVHKSRLGGKVETHAGLRSGSWCITKGRLRLALGLGRGEGNRFGLGSGVGGVATMAQHQRNGALVQADN